MFSQKLIEKYEKQVDAIIPYCLFFLLIIISIDLFFYEFAVKNHTLFVIFEIQVIIVFVIDLSFKYMKLHNMPLFLKKYWFDIVLIFPFFLFFRFIEELFSIVKITESLEKSQQVLHSSVEIQKELKILFNNEKILLRGVRMLRILKYLPYAHRHHLSY